MSGADLALLVPELLLTALAFVVLAADLFMDERRRPILAGVAAAGMVAICLVTVSVWGRSGIISGGLYVIDPFANLFKLLSLLMAAVVVLASIDYAKRSLPNAGEYYGLIVFATLGMFVMTAAGELITAYLGLELVNFSLYALASYHKWNPKSNEAGVKYLLLGALSSAILLYGLSLLYGLAGTTYYAGISVALQGATLSPGLIAALALVLTGIGFKVAAVPFHMWAPDVYEGSPTPITAFLSVASKAAGFGLLLRIAVEAIGPAVAIWSPAIAILAALTMVLGNTVAIQQRNVKRLLAYSSIGQVGYLLLGIAAASDRSTEAIILHIAGYAATNLVAFLAVIVVQTRTGAETIEEYAGLAQRAPLVAFSLTVALFSLAGMPLLAGFVTKFYLFLAAAESGLLPVVGLAILMSVVSLYYYLMVIKQMYVKSPDSGGPIAIRLLDRLLFIGLLAVILVIGLYPAPLFDVVQLAAKSLF